MKLHLQSLFAQPCISGTTATAVPRLRVAIKLVIIITDALAKGLAAVTSMLSEAENPEYNFYM